MNLRSSVVFLGLAALAVVQACSQSSTTVLASPQTATHPPAAAAGNPSDAGTVPARAPATASAAEPAAAPAEPDARYAALTVNGNKIGYLKTTRSAGTQPGPSASQPALSVVTTVVEHEESARREKALLTQKARQTYVETADGRAVSFTSTVRTTAQPTRTLELAFADGRARLTTTVGTQSHTQEAPWPADILMPEAEARLIKRMGFKEGTTYSYRRFAGDPASIPVTTVTVGKTAAVELLGRSAELTELQVQARDGRGNVSASTRYVDADGRELKFVMQRVGATMATIACDREYALGKNKLVNVMSALPKCPPLPGIEQAASATFTLTPLHGRKLSVPDTAAQAARLAADGTVTVTVTPASMPRGAALPYAGQDPELRAATRPARYLQADDDVVKALAKTAIGNAADAGAAARRIVRFVRGYIISSDAVSFASAQEVARGRRGDCTEHAVLTAAMLRSVGVPARVVVGVVYTAVGYGQKDILVPHAWVQARIGELWVDVDSALGKFDAGHIAFAVGDGDPESLQAAYDTIGFFKVSEARVIEGAGK